MCYSYLSFISLFFINNLENKGLVRAEAIAKYVYIEVYSHILSD